MSRNSFSGLIWPSHFHSIVGSWSSKGEGADDWKCVSCHVYVVSCPCQSHAWHDNNIHLLLLYIMYSSIHRINIMRYTVRMYVYFRIGKGSSIGHVCVRYTIRDEWMAENCDLFKKSIELKWVRKILSFQFQ